MSSGTDAPFGCQAHTHDTEDPDGPQIPVPEEFAAPIRQAMAESQARKARTHTEVAVDRDALVDLLYDFAGKGLTTFADKFETRRASNAVADALLKSGLFLDATAVRHEHGERIAEDHEASAASLPNTIERRTYQTAADRARILSPAPPEVQP